MKIEPARSLDNPFFCLDIFGVRTLIRFEPEWNFVNGMTDMVKELCECHVDYLRTLGFLYYYRTHPKFLTSSSKGLTIIRDEEC